VKKLSFWLAVTTLSSISATAQVKVEITAEQDTFLPGEPLTAITRISNRTGQPLRFGSAEDWLTFTVEASPGGPVQKLSDPVVKGEFTLPSGSRATKRVDLSPYFSLTQPGRYLVSASVKVPGWNQESPSQPFFFNVIEGSHLWEQEFGVPGSSDGSTPPEVRKYILQQANYLKNKLRLYVRITDSTGARVFKTIPVGTVLTFSRPQPEIDDQNNLHLLYQSWAHTFAYFVYSPNGDLLKSAMYDYIGERPRIARDPKGHLTVVGGILRDPAKQVEPDSILTTNSVGSPKQP
jgi:hypothetical protein